MLRRLSIQKTNKYNRELSQELSMSKISPRTGFLRKIDIFSLPLPSVMRTDVSRRPGVRRQCTRAPAMRRHAGAAGNRHRSSAAFVAAAGFQARRPAGGVSRFEWPVRRSAGAGPRRCVGQRTRRLRSVRECSILAAPPSNPAAATTGRCGFGTRRGKPSPTARPVGGRWDCSLPRTGKRNGSRATCRSSAEIMNRRRNGFGRPMTTR